MNTNYTDDTDDDGNPQPTLETYIRTDRWFLEVKKCDGK